MPFVMRQQGNFEHVPGIIGINAQDGAEVASTYFSKFVLCDNINCDMIVPLLYVLAYSLNIFWFWLSASYFFSSDFFWFP